ncbi:MAG: trypsin-like peptidase domain-containing protein [Sedimentisphaerales bacterium]|nr:trypsin-like peptidase domain-containing protein [Sedimentisphaerales bacterium]
MEVWIEMNHSRWLPLAGVLLSIGYAGVLRSEEKTPFNRETPVVRVYRETHKTVVNISGQRTVARRIWPDFDPDLWGPRFQQEVSVLGSGFVVHQDGFIVTNAHVAEDASRIKVVFSDGREFQANIISIDASRDLAVLAIETPEKLPFVELGCSSDLMIGETAIAIGNPYGYANTITSGVISAVGRDIQVAEGYWLRGLIQTDAPINPGNSGGPLLNVNGQLIGINTAIRAEAQNIGFAIPVDALVDNLSHMLMPEKLRRVRLGLTVGRMKTAGGCRGLVIDAVSKGSPAEEKGLAKNDLITQVDEHELHSVIDFYVRLMDKEIGEPIRLRCVSPAEKDPEVRVVELAMLPRPLPDGRLRTQRYFQMAVSELTADVARRFNFQGAYPILIITDVDPQGVAARAGIQSGDLVLQINGVGIQNLRELSLAMEEVAEEDIVELQILRISLGVFGQIERRFVVPLQARTPQGRRYAL